MSDQKRAPNRWYVLAGLLAAPAAIGASLALTVPQRLAGSPVARIVGANDHREAYASRKFTGPGWYALWDGECGSPRRIMWAFRDDHPFIALSAGAGRPIEVYVSHRTFDRACWGAFHPVPAGREAAL